MLNEDTDEHRWLVKPGDKIYYSVGNWHSGKANVLFSDLHVEGHKKDYIDVIGAKYWIATYLYP